LAVSDRKQDATKAQDLVEKTLAARPISPSEGIDRTCLLPVGNFVFNKTLDNPLETNNAIEYVLQIRDSTDELYARLILFAHLVNQPAFSVLRTEEQLGYIVSSWSFAQVNAIAMGFRIQSEKPALFVENRVDIFLENYKEVLRTMKLDDFAKQRQGLVGKLRERLNNLQQESTRFEFRILDGSYDFSLRTYQSTRVCF
jgi:insulysin